MAGALAPLSANWPCSNSEYASTSDNTTFAPEGSTFSTKQCLGGLVFATCGASTGVCQSTPGGRACRANVHSTTSDGAKAQSAASAATRGVHNTKGGQETDARFPSPSIPNAHSDPVSRIQCILARNGATDADAHTNSVQPGFAAKSAATASPSADRGRCFWVRSPTSSYVALFDHRADTRPLKADSFCQSIQRPLLWRHDRPCVLRGFMQEIQQKGNHGGRLLRWGLSSATSRPVWSHFAIVLGVSPSELEEY